MPSNDPNDPRGLIAQAYQIDGITSAECRSIFLDWALKAPGGDLTQTIQHLLTLHGPAAPDHPMTHTLTAALADAGPARRRGGRAGRLAR